ncbi:MULTISPECIES: ABC transporter substrate-binding protein [unclassified Bradyrhizobium]|uniref:ABC transporter substrate-binding protein n=1 Tax=unclassified Bradyrhizobium TaxID=2631580 RepID=UPI0028EA5761|nr:MULTISPECIES: ABC transporter substrate-binding protein [unclassified Bradyrhizobium]
MQFLSLASCIARRSLSPAILAAVFLTGSASGALSADNVNLVRELAGRVGPIIGSSQACTSIATRRVQAILAKFQEAIREASTNPNDRNELAREFERNIAEGRAAVNGGRADCRLVERQLADLERSVGAPPPGPATSAAPAGANAAVSTARPAAPGEVRGVTDQEIRFGMVIPYTGSAKENGQSYKRGIEVAFARSNAAGGVHGRMLKLIAADDGFEPSRTPEAMKLLWDRERVFGFLGNLGTPTAAVAVPFALERRVLFFAPFTGGSVVRHDPPDRYVFNYRPSFVEEADAAVRYLLKMRKIRPNQIAVFGQNDDLGEQGFAGVARAYRAAGLNDASIVRLVYNRNSIDMDEAVAQLRAQKVPIKAIVMVGTTRPAAKFIEKTRDLFPGMIYTNMSIVGATALAQELMLLGPRFTENVIVTQAVPAVSGYSSTVLEFKAALAQASPGEVPDYISLEGYVAANLLIDALKRCGPQLDTERLVETLESTRNLDMGLGASLNLSRGDHQALHKVWGTQLDKSGSYQPIDLE